MPIGLFGPELRWFPERTKIIPHHEVKQFAKKYPSFAEGGVTTANQPTTIDKTTNVTINVSGKVLDQQAFKQFVKEIKQELARQSRLRTEV